MKSSENKQIVLVTGGTGFIGIYCILKLLKEGYSVKTTVRSLNRKEEVISLLRTSGINTFENLTFIEADLTKDHNWDEAVKDCTYVLHVASPFPGSEPEDENDLIIPAKEGALRVLKAARDAGVKRVVLTSSFAAIGYGKDIHNHVFTEVDWTNTDVISAAYIKSKTLAEKAAWDFIKAEGGTLELSVINPVGVFGPALGKDYSTSVNLIKSVLDGSMTTTPPFTFGVVDVRDVADVHLLAMVHPDAKGERFLAAADGIMSLYDAAELIKKERPELVSKISDLQPLDPALYLSMSNRKARTVLGWNPRSKEESILASADSLAD